MMPKDFNMKPVLVEKENTQKELFKKQDTVTKKKAKKAFRKAEHVKE